jgi:hypothetical protein
LGHAVHHEAGQMVGWQTVAQPHRQIEYPVVVHLFEFSTHILTQNRIHVKFYQKRDPRDRNFARILGLPLFMVWRAGTLFSLLMASWLAVHGFDAIQVSPR